MKEVELQSGLKILMISEVKRRVGKQKSSVYAWIRDGKFPAPTKLANGRNAWTEQAIDRWIRDQLGGAPCR